MKDKSEKWTYDKVVNRVKEIAPAARTLAAASYFLHFIKDESKREQFYRDCRLNIKQEE